MRFLLVILISFFVSFGAVAKEYNVLVGNKVGSNDSLYMRTFMAASGVNYQIQYMPGASSRTALDYLLKNKDKEILMLAVLNLPMNMVMSDDPVPLSSLEWVGSLSGETSVLVTNKQNSKINTFKDLQKKKIFFARSINFSEDIYNLVNSRVGTKFEFVKGYKGRSETLLAIQRNEADVTNSSTAGDGISNFKPIVQMRMSRDPVLANVPSLNEYVRDNETKKIFTFLLMPYTVSHPLLLAPGTSNSVLAQYRKMFDTVVLMPKYKKALADLKLNDSPVSGLELEKIFKSYPDGAKLVKKALAR